MNISCTSERTVGRFRPATVLLALPLVSLLSMGCGSDSNGSDSTGLTGLGPMSGKPSMSRLGKALGVITSNPPAIGGTNPGMMQMQPPPPPPMTGSARVKFCHFLTYKDMNVTLEVQIGSQRLVAMTDGCSTAAGQACQMVPSGRQKLTLVFQGQTLSSTEYDFVDGKEYGIFADVDGEGPYLGGGPMGSALTCARASAEDVTSLGGTTPPMPPPVNPPPVTPPVTPPTSGATCGGQTASSACTQCTYGSCCTEIQACTTSQSCVALVNCVGACPDNDDACIRKCLDTNSAGVPALTGYLDCRKAKCDAACNTGAPPPMGMGMPPMPPPVTPPPVTPPPVTPPPVTPPPVTPPAAGAAFKFCHDVTFGGGMPVEFELTVGTAKLRATTGKCSPAPGMACTAIPSGAQPRVLRDITNNREVLKDTVQITAGTNYVFGVSIGDTGPSFIQATGSAAQCAAFTVD